MDQNKTTNVQGGKEKMVEFEGERRQTRRALSIINQNLEAAHQVTGTNGICNKNSTRKFGATQIGSIYQHYPEENKKPKVAVEDFKVWEEDEATKDQPTPMCLEQSETLSNDKITEMEVEMEDVFEEALTDIDRDDANNPLAVVDYVGDLYANYRKMEIYSCVSPNYMDQQLDINGYMRAILIDWIIEVHLKFELKEETLYLTVSLIDRFLEKQAVAIPELQLVGLVALLLASKYEEISVLVDGLVKISANTYSRKDVLEMEKVMLITLQFTISVPTAYVFMKRFLKAAQADKKLEVFSFFLIELCLVEYEMLKYPPSFMAAAAIYTAQCMLYGVKEWSTTCEWHTGYSEDLLLECARSIVSYHQKAATGKLTGVHRKYSASKFGYAAKLEPAHFLVKTQQ